MLNGLLECASPCWTWSDPPVLSSGPELARALIPSFISSLLKSFFKFFLFFYPFMENQIEDVSFSCCLLKRGLDMKNRAGSRGGCPLINLSSPRHTVQPRRPSLIYTLWGNDRQAFGPTASAPCLDAERTGSGRTGGGSPLEPVQGEGKPKQQSPLYSTRQ